MITIDFEKLGIKYGFRILDIGCGSGRHTCALWEYNDVTVIGVDLAINDLKEARTRLQYHEALKSKSTSRWKLICADISITPFADDYFDAVICSEVLEHIANPNFAVPELFRVLKPNGIIAVSVPRYWPEKLCWLLSKEYSNSNGGHIRIYKKNELMTLFKNQNAILTGIHYAHSFHTPYWWLKCLLGITREDISLIHLYHRFLTWDMMKKSRPTRFIESLLNPIMGKSTVMYFRKVR